jgi:D-glycero-D-manno-heptose 1,7-bisphosphate phosphatase
MLLKPYSVPAHYTAKAIFLDRDGILNQEVGDYVYDPELFIIPEGVPEALQALKAAGYKLIVVTNQGGLDKDLYTRADLAACHAKLEAAAPGLLDYIYYSPHHKTKTLSQLSKPNSLMVERGLHRYQARPENCYLIGDAGRDLEAAAAVGIKGILVPTLKEHEHELAVHIASDLRAAAAWILERIEN